MAKNIKEYDLDAEVKCKNSERYKKDLQQWKNSFKADASIEYFLFNNINVVSATLGSIIYAINKLEIETELGYEPWSDETIDNIIAYTTNIVILGSGTIGGLVIPNKDILLSISLYSFGSLMNFFTGNLLAHIACKALPYIFNNDYDTSISSALKIASFIPLAAYVLDKAGLNLPISFYSRNEAKDFKYICPPFVHHYYDEVESCKNVELIPKINTASFTGQYAALSCISSSTSIGQSASFVEYEGIVYDAIALGE